MIGKPDILTIMEREGIEIKRGKALCPFHNERTPSFIVNQARQTFHCFGCGAHGDVITFIMKLKGLSFKDALSYLGMAPGKPIPIDPDIQRRRKLQQSYEKAIAGIYDKLCERSRHLHQIRLQVKRNPGAVTEAGAVLFAEQMGVLVEIDHKLDSLLTGTVDDQISILQETMKNDCTKTVSRAA
jgi:DNA primase